MYFPSVHKDVRKWTKKVIEGMDGGLLFPQDIAEMCLSYMSEDQVEDMCRANDLKDYLGNDEEEDDE